MNGLKLVNDTLGHLKGDLYLCRIARILEESCRKVDKIPLSISFGISAKKNLIRIF
jgi:predicted signal transduction protein with EAL and GGDEF domain